MIILALLLATVGAADLVRRDASAVRRGDVPVLVAFGVAIIGGVLLGLGWHTAWIAPLGALVVSVWLYGREEPRWRVAALGVLVAALLLAAGLGQYVPLGRAPILSWYESLDVPGLASVGLDRFALGIGVLLFLQQSANVVVRHVLDQAGPEVLAVEQTLKGGRLLGPLERVFVFGLALAGAYTAFAALVAAKGILRYPEISRDEPDGSKAEYVLLGSFVSWALALVFVPLF